jgi:hypothetical protein
LTNAIFKRRRSARLEKDMLCVTVLEEGGHIAEVLDKRVGVSPFWIPHWTSLEPSDFSPHQDSNFGTGADAKLLAGIMGHNLCLDLFGAPSPEEAVAGFTVHGEASVGRYDITESSGQLLQRMTLPWLNSSSSGLFDCTGSTSGFAKSWRISARWTVPSPGRSSSR